MSMSDAEIAHRSVRGELRRSKLILHRSPKRLVHPVVERVLSPQGSERRDGSSGICRDHGQLWDSLRAGAVPTGGGCEGDNNVMFPPNLALSLQLARERGYQVPDRFLTERAPTSIAEKCAWYAAHHIVRTPASGFFDDEVDERGAPRWAIRQLTGSFLVPHPEKQWRAPYVLDQLWIVGGQSYGGVRLVALEIDGEHHLSPENAQRDRERDAALFTMGYEVYRAAGWWCRIDPFRVVLEFLNAAGIGYEWPGFVGQGDLVTMDDYVCTNCSDRMVRENDDDIAIDRSPDDEGGYVESVVCRDCWERSR